MFKKYEFIYDEENDIYICPNEKDLIPCGKINKDGYLSYKVDGKMKYGLTKTYFRSKKKVHRELTLLYTCMNLKKFAYYHKIGASYSSIVNPNPFINSIFRQIKRQISKNNTYLSTV